MRDILSLPARHTRRAPVFVIGAPRSGTSLLCTLLRRYLQINFGTESQFIVRVYRRLPAYGDLRSPLRLRRLVDDIARERCFERWMGRFGFVLDPNRVYRDALDHQRSYAGVLDAIFSQFARYHGLPRWGDKTPEYNYDLPVLLSLFPQAQFVHILRDGRDVALSTLRMGFGGANVYRAAVNWREQLLRIQHFTAPLPPLQVLTVRYEALLADASGTLDTISTFLGIEPDAALASAIAGDIPARVRSGNCGKWRKEMSPAQQRLFESVAGDQLEANNYLSPPYASPAPGWAARLWWEADHRLRKAVKPQYWSDHLYRAKLRAAAGRRARTARAQPQVAEGAGS